MPPKTRARSGPGGDVPTKELPPERQRRHRARKGEQGNRTEVDTQMDEGQPPAATGMVTTRPLSCEDTRPDRTLSNTPHERESQPLYLNPIQNTRMGEPVHSQTAPPTLSPRPPNPSAHLTRPLPEPLHHSPNSQPTLPSTQPAESPSAHPTQHRQRMPRKPRGITQKGLKQSMQLHSSTVAKHAYNKFRERVRTKMKDKGEGTWLIWDDVPKQLKDWLVNAITNDSSIPFVRQYGEWAILGAAQGTARGWRKQRYQDHTIQVPENKRYLAANSAKRNQSSPRGARFPARPSTQNRSPTPDDNDNDGRIPVLPPGPSTTTSSAGFYDGGAGWYPGPPSNHPTHPIPGSSQPVFSAWSFPQAQSSIMTPTLQWGPTNPPNFPPPGALTNVNYLESPSSASPIFHPPDMRNDPRAPQPFGYYPNVNGPISQVPSRAFSVGQGSTPLGPTHSQPQQPLNQHANAWSATNAFNGPPSAPYRLTPDDGNTNDERVQTQPEQGRTSGHPLPGPSHPQPQQPLDRRTDDESHLRPSDQGPSGERL